LEGTRHKVQGTRHEKDTRHKVQGTRKAHGTSNKTQVEMTLVNKFLITR